MPLPSDPAARHRAVAATFAQTTRAVVDWDAPTPVPEWTTGDVVGHLVAWLPGFLAGGSSARLPEVPLDDPVAAWERRAADVQALLDDPAAAELPFTNPHTGVLPLREAVDRFYTTDVLMHAWDLARAAGRPDPIPADVAEEMLAGMSAIEELLRSSGQFGPAAPAPTDATPGDRLMAFLGRDAGRWPNPTAP
jgi:uncharacterized protein (TIGR03086 family)